MENKYTFKTMQEYRKNSDHVTLRQDARISLPNTVQFCINRGGWQLQRNKPHTSTDLSSSHEVENCVVDLKKKKGLSHQGVTHEERPFTYFQQTNGVCVGVH